MKKIFPLTLLSLVLCFASFAILAQESQPKKGQGVVFKIPDDVFPMDWTKSGKFKGILMLRKDLPSGLFVTYPNEKETIDELITRVGKYIPGMFLGSDKDTDIEKLVPTISTIPIHSGDVEGSGRYYLFSTDKTQVQILFYKRTSNGNAFIYGYFANKHIASKDKGAIDGWADTKGQGIKIFEDFWKTFRDQ